MEKAGSARLFHVTLPSFLATNLTKGEGDELKLFCEEDNGPEITIPERVRWIDDWAFHNCTKLTSVTIPDTVTWIGDFAFTGCTGLTSNIIPASVTHIGSSAFDGCTNLRSVTIQNPRINIGPGAFKNTPFLEDCPDDFVMCDSILIRYKGDATEVQMKEPFSMSMYRKWMYIDDHMPIYPYDAEKKHTCVIEKILK